MIRKQLILVFADALDGEYRLYIDDPKEDLTALTVQNAMDQIILADVFHVKGQSLKNVVSAYTREVIVSEMI